MEKTQLDVVVALGQNWGRPLLYRLRRRWQHIPLELSAASKLDAVAAATLYKEGKTKEIIFSSGHTAGENVPSEAQAMKAYVRSLFPDIPENVLLTEDVSIDTAQNAQEVGRMLRSREDTTVGLLTLSSHGKRAERLFAAAAVPISQLFAADRLPIDDPVYTEHVAAFRRSKHSLIRPLYERIALASVQLEETLGLKPGSILRTISRHTRR